MNKGLDESREFLKAMLDRQEHGKREQNGYLDDMGDISTVLEISPSEKTKGLILSSIPSFTVYSKVYLK